MQRTTFIAAITVSALALIPPDAARTLAQTDQGPSARSPFNPPNSDDEPPPMPLAIGGYCVVTLRDHQQWQLGDRRVGGAFDGRQYLFASPRERAIFAAAPEKYVPVLGGDCVVTYAETGERVPGQLRFGNLRGGRLYFMASEERLGAFTADPARYVDADLADGGRCPVTLHDSRRIVPGIPETVATHAGLRYYFASAHQRSQFLIDPVRYAVGGSVPSNSSVAGRVASTPISAAPVDSEEPRDGAESEGTSAGGDEILLDAQPLMGGYCPVTIRQTGAWVRGRYDYRAEFGSLIFLTAGPSEHDALMQDPAQYLPAVGGDCIVSLVDESRRVRGSIFHAAEYQGRLFLFADAQHKAAFKADPSHYALIDVAAAGVCVVTQVDASRTVPGTPKYAAWHNGLIYRFAGPAERKKFLSAPERYAVELPAMLNNSDAEAPAPDAAPTEPAGQSAVAQ